VVENPDARNRENPKECVGENDWGNEGENHQWKPVPGADGLRSCVTDERGPEQGNEPIEVPGESPSATRWGGPRDGGKGDGPKRIDGLVVVGKERTGRREVPEEPANSLNTVSEGREHASIVNLWDFPGDNGSGRSGNIRDAVVRPILEPNADDEQETQTAKRKEQGIGEGLGTEREPPPGEDGTTNQTGDELMEGEGPEGGLEEPAMAREGRECRAGQTKELHKCTTAHVKGRDGREHLPPVVGGDTQNRGGERPGESSREEQDAASQGGATKVHIGPGN
jgi:hypothetical protein